MQWKDSFINEFWRKMCLRVEVIVVLNSEQNMLMVLNNGKEKCLESAWWQCHWLDSPKQYTVAIELSELSVLSSILLGPWRPRVLPNQMGEKYDTCTFGSLGCVGKNFFKLWCIKSRMTSISTYFSESSVCPIVFVHCNLSWLIVQGVDTSVVDPSLPWCHFW